MLVKPNRLETSAEEANTVAEGAIFTVGHSTLPIDRFITLIDSYIERLADVRPVPRSPSLASEIRASVRRRASHFHRVVLDLDIIGQVGVTQAVQTRFTVESPSSSRCRSIASRRGLSQHDRQTQFAGVKGQGQLAHASQAVGLRLAPGESEAATRQKP
jgi:hypothetical protein